MPPSLLVVTTLMFGASYDSSRDRADLIPNLGRFLEEYLGDCMSNDPAFNRNECEAAAEKVRKENRGKLFRIELDSRPNQLEFAGWDERRKAFRAHLTPFFGERGLALTVGKPRKLSKDGYPILPNLPIWLKLPSGETEFIFRRRVERGALRLELVFRPQRTWAFEHAADGPMRGVAVNLVGVRVYDRSGKVLAEQSY